MARRHRERNKGFRIDRAGEARISLDDHRHPAADDVSERGRGAARVGHDLQFDAGPAVQEQARQVGDASYAGRGKTDFAGMLLGACDQIG